MSDIVRDSVELARVSTAFAWDLSVFGLQQFANLVDPQKATASFQRVGEAMQREISDGSFARASSSQILDLAQRQTQQSTLPNTGWGPIPYPVVPPSPTTSQPISADYPFQSNYTDVLGTDMHYVDVGEGDPILFLHGNPTWSYLWRNIIPYLQPMGRCIAPDLVGYGRSGKPDIEYTWADHVRYLEAFIEKLGLKNITLVLHDQGSNLGFHYAMRNESNIKGIAFFEAIIRPYQWEEFSTPEFRELFKTFRTGGRGGPGWKMIVEENFFIEALLPQAAGRPLSETELNFYREPFRTEASRIPVWQFPQQTPIGGQPPDVWKAVSEYSKRLQKSKLPKLLLYAKPGRWLQTNISSGPSAISKGSRRRSLVKALTSYKRVVRTRSVSSFNNGFRSCLATPRKLRSERTTQVRSNPLWTKPHTFISILHQAQLHRFGLAATRLAIVRRRYCIGSTMEVPTTGVVSQVIIGSVDRLRSSQ